MNSRFRDILIMQLKEELQTAKQIDTDELADEIHNIGFDCLICGKCCRREYGDNRVVVIPEEVRRIQNYSGMEWNNIAEPLNIEMDSAEEEYSFQKESGMIDEDGSIHTFGWMLHRKKNRDCTFIPDESTDNRCRIYKLRPLLCSTYPFYMEGLKLKTSECEGLGRESTWLKSKAIADLVLKRYLCELQDTILTYENYNGFMKGKNGQIIAESNMKQGYLNYAVHSSEGTCNITKMI